MNTGSSVRKTPSKEKFYLGHLYQIHQNTLFQNSEIKFTTGMGTASLQPPLSAPLTYPTSGVKLSHCTGCSLCRPGYAPSSMMVKISRHLSSCCGCITVSMPLGASRNCHYGNCGVGWLRPPAGLLPCTPASI